MMDKDMTLEEYFSSKDKAVVYFSDNAGLVNGEISDRVPPAHAYILQDNDFRFDKATNSVILNIGNYSDRNILCLLKRVFIPFDDMSFDICGAIKQEKSKLVLINEIVNQKQVFFEEIYSFFKKLDVEPEYRGHWSLNQ